VILDHDRWQRLSPLLDRALDLDIDERSAWLLQLRGDDETLAAELEALLKEQEALEREGFLARSPFSAFAQQSSLVGQTIGAYTLEAPLGQGGMGTVWLARRSDGRFEGKVAIKLLNAALVGRAGEERFQREGSILARLTHPNIARLIDAGVSPTGQPYLVIEYVEGERIDSYCDVNRLGVAARLRLFLDVLAAVAHAHANLVIHRDIKPSNVLVGDRSTVKLLDFGIAKLLEDEAALGDVSQLTRDAGRALTPEFAAPEQLLGNAVTTATDVYALGVLLYVLLAGQHPIGDCRRSPAALIEAIVDTDPPRLSDTVGSTKTLTVEALRDNAGRRAATPERLRHQLKGDLENIVAKALKKDPQERYASVTAFADDIRRHLGHEPVSARADALGYRAAKFVRRNRVAVALSALAAVAMIGGLAGTITQADRATRQALIAEEQRNRADDQARAATEQRDFALRQLSRAEAINDFNAFLLSDAAPSGKPFTAGELLSRAEAIIDRQHDESDANRAEMLVVIGRQFRIMDRNDEARRLLGRAYEIAQKLPDRTTRARAACNLASALSRAGEYDRAETLFREGLTQLPQEAQYTLDRIACLLEGGTIARESNFNDAVVRVREAQALLPQLPYPSSFLEMRVLMDLAESYRMAADYPEALGAFELAYARLVALGRENTETAGTIYNNWALALDITGQMLKAEKLFRRAVQISSDEASDKNVSPMLLTNLARVLIRLERVDEAARLADQAYERARAAGDTIVVRDSMLIRAMAYRGLGDLARAETLLNDAEVRYRSTRPPDCACFATLAVERAELAQAHGDSSAALAWADKAVSIAQTDPRRRDISPYFLLRRAELALDQNRFDAAKADAAKSIELDLPTLVPGTQSSYLGRAYLALGRALIATGHADDARDALSSAAQHLRPSLGADHSQTKLADKLLATTVASSR